MYKLRWYRRWRPSYGGQSYRPMRLLGLMVVFSVVVANMTFYDPGRAFGSVGRDVARSIDVNSAAMPAISSADRARMDAQAPYMQLYESIKQFADKLRPSPMAGARLDVKGKRLFVYWAGAVPAEFDAFRATASAAGFSLRVEPAAHSEKQIMDAAIRLSRFAESTGTSLSAKLHVDGSGLTVQSDGLGAAMKNRAARTPTLTRLMSAIDAITAETGVRVNGEDGPVRAWTSSRGADTPPFKAGAVTLAAGSNCTSGFSMYATGAPTKFMMTAAHCTNYADGIQVTTGAGLVMGQSSLIHQLFDFEPRYDLGVIQLAGHNNAPQMYLDFAPPATVGGMAPGVPANGNYCISGAVALANCNIISGEQVMFCGDQVDPPIRFGRCIHYISYTSLPNPVGHVLCFGDSGGPIYYWSGSKIIAAGVQSLGLGDPNPSGCFASGAMSVVASAVNRYNISGLRVRTG